MAEQEIPDCGVHKGACSRCGLEIQQKPRPRKRGEEKRKRKTVTLRVPDDSENGAGIYDDTLLEVKERLVQLELYSTDDKIPAYEATIAAWRDWLDSLQFPLPEPGDDSL
jgi:hypothetical protein